MKRYFALLLAVILVLALFSGCKNTEPDDSATDDTTGTVNTTDSTEDSTQDSTSDTTGEEEPEQDWAAVLQLLREDFPAIDGSTSLIPLEAGIRSVIFNKSLEEATLDVVHTTTWQSFYNLMHKDVDLLLSVPMSKEQIEYSEGKLEQVAVAKEGFVFVVNARNPVSKLTQQQIKDIYSGKITNWSQVGGLDEEIIPYQRNINSGSQNFMLEFMGDTPLTDAPMEQRPASMDGLMDVIAVSDNSRQAIGYSVYAYAADMYGNGNEIKFIQVDGVAPSKKTFADGTYPLLGINYAVFHKDEPADGNVRQLVDWMVSFDGQTAIAKAGYVTIMDIGFDYEEMTFQKYNATGKGELAKPPASYEYVYISHVPQTYGLEFYEGMKPYVITLADGTKTYRIDRLVNKDIEEQITAFIDEHMAEYQKELPKMLKLLHRLNGSETEYPIYALHYQAEESGAPGICEVSCRNGYLSVTVALAYTYNVMEGHTFYYKTATANWNLLTGSRLTNEELFCENIAIDDVLNSYITTYSEQPYSTWGNTMEKKQEFVGLGTTGWHITSDAIYFDHDNPWFAYGYKIPLKGLPDGVLCADNPWSFADCVDTVQGEVRKRFRDLSENFTYKYIDDHSISCGFLRENSHPNAKKVNAAVLDYLNTYYSRDAVIAYFTQMGYPQITDYLYMMDWYPDNLGNRYVIFSGTRPNYYEQDSDSFLYYDKPSCLLFDLETGEEIHFSKMLKEGWLENSKMVTSYPETEVTPFYEGLDLFWLNFTDTGDLWVCLETPDSTECYYLTIPQQYIIFE